MSATLQGTGAATPLSPFNSIDSNKLVPPSLSSLSVRSKRYIVVRYDGSKSFGSGLIAHRSEPLIVAKVVATKADSAASSTSSKQESCCSNNL